MIIGSDVTVTVGPAAPGPGPRPSVLARLVPRPRYRTVPQCCPARPLTWAPVNGPWPRHAGQLASCRHSEPG
eukprot:766567-Hanusia_phi.AAC.2